MFKMKFGGLASRALKVVPTPKAKSKLERVVVPASVVDRCVEDPAALVQAVVNYVNFMINTGRFNRTELPPGAIQAYHCDYYLAQVNNGGHAQFVGNCGGNLSFTLPDIVDGLTAMKAKEHLKLAKKMARWVKKNPDEAEEQTGFEGGIAPELAALDAPFFELEKDHSITLMNARWIATWEHLEVVEDAKFEAVLNSSADMNPHKQTREAAAQVAQIAVCLSDPLRLGLGMAAGRIRPAEAMTWIGGGSYREVEGEEQLAWSLGTTEGDRFAVVDDDFGVRMYGCIRGDNPHLKDFRGPQDLDKVSLDDVMAYQPDQVGARLSEVPIDELLAAKDLAERLNAASMIAAMLDRVDSSAKFSMATLAHAGPNASGEDYLWVIVLLNDGRDAYSAIVTADQGILYSEPGQKVLLSIEASEAAAYLQSFKDAA
ncbi:MAG: DUF4375 domain-containing protein [Rhodobacteraceae bacterium]|nr:DUF4375 domain-containing protein [Paracoccaceae bacterium]